ncbi:MAG TPA: hypothetical protein VFB82_23060 [Blastocatellia bacterium]|nr:hypothetical protein [Blastocatellia bacterium]
MTDKSQDQNAEKPKKANALGVLFVHGIGSQKRGDTLVQWGDVLANTINRSCRGKATATVDAAHIVEASTAAQGVPAYARLSVQTEGHDPSSWLLCEAWWAETLATPSYSQLVSWSVRSIPWLLVVHFALRFRTLRIRIAAESKRLRKGLLMAEMLLGSIGGFLLAMLAAPFLVALLGLLLIVGRIPIPNVRSFVGAVQRKLTGTAGDSLILLESPIQAAAIRSIVRDAVQWLDDSCDQVAVVAHSQGAAVSMEALGGFASAEPLHSSDYQPPDGLHTLVTFGSGVNKLAALKLLAKPGESSAGEKNSAASVNPWAASLLLLVVLLLGVGVWLQVVSGALKGADFGHAVTYFLIIFGMMLLALISGYIAKKCGGSEQTVKVTAVGAALVGIAFLFYFLWDYGVSGFFVFGFSALIFLVILVIGLFREEVLTSVGQTVRRPAGVKTWCDFYASADPVPNGKTIVSQGGPDSVEVWSSGSRFKDHTTYWRNIEGFVIPLIRCLAKTVVSPLAEHLPVESDWVSARAQRRVRWLQTARVMVFIAVVVSLIIRRLALVKFGAELRARVPSALGLPSFIQTSAQVNDAMAIIVAASTILIAGWIGYGVVLYSWGQWCRTEQRVVARHDEPDGTPATFWVFGAALAAVLAVVPAFENAAMHRWLFPDLEWIKMAKDFIGAWFGFTLLALLPVFVLSRKGFLALRRPKSSEEAA